MDLFIHPASPNCIAVLAAARIVQQPLNVEHVDLFAGEQYRPSFLAVNPNGLVPVLRDGDFVLWETIAILQYIAALDPEARLLPSAPKQRADISRWLAWGVAHWNPSLRPFVMERLINKRMQGSKAPDEALLERSQSTLDKTTSILEQQLSRSAFVCGDQVSIADLHLAAVPIYAPHARIDFTRYPRLQRWLESVHSLPEWQVSSGGSMKMNP
ncbi:glutathione S-transferase family protein [Trinickia sp. LjRoot230]|uniref:glutathione S-transferase family protein n=1 Tax=Trinickia sp. LjRoot230 TaxID=3342288 RepID=UPI003ECD20C2